MALFACFLDPKLDKIPVRNVEVKWVQYLRAWKNGVMVGKHAEKISTAGSRSDQFPMAVESGGFESVDSFVNFAILLIAF